MADLNTKVQHISHLYTWYYLSADACFGFRSNWSAIANASAYPSYSQAQHRFFLTNGTAFPGSTHNSTPIINPPTSNTILHSIHIRRILHQSLQQLTPTEQRIIYANFGYSIRHAPPPLVYCFTSKHSDYMPTILAISEPYSAVLSTCQRIMDDEHTLDDKELVKQWATLAKNTYNIAVNKLYPLVRHVSVDNTE